MIDDVHQMQGLSQKSRLGNLTRYRAVSLEHEIKKSFECYICINDDEAENIVRSSIDT